MAGFRENAERRESRDRREIGNWYRTTIVPSLKRIFTFVLDTSGQSLNRREKTDREDRREKIEVMIDKIEEKK